MRGAFYIPSLDIEIPNTLTTFGIENIFRYGLHDPLGADFYWGLGNKALDSNIMFASQMSEPSFINGYENIDWAWRTPELWQAVRFDGEEAYVETKEIVFTASGDYDKTVSRIFAADAATDQIICISNPLPNAPLQITTPGFTTRYRIYGR